MTRITKQFDGLNYCSICIKMCALCFKIYASASISLHTDFNTVFEFIRPKSRSNAYWTYSGSLSKYNDRINYINNKIKIKENILWMPN